MSHQQSPRDRVEQLADVPICIGCGLMSHLPHEQTLLCGDCWQRRNTWQHSGCLRYVPLKGDTKHETPRCPELTADYAMAFDELVYLDTEQCDTCYGYILFGEFDRLAD